MTGRRWLAIAALALGSAVSPGVSLSAEAQGQSVSLQLASQNNSGITGTATIADVGDGKLKVDISATGAGAGPQPAHIHEGACAQLNPAPKFSLTEVRNGTSTTTIDGTFQALTVSPHAIHMHKSPDELPVYVACADIRMGAQAATTSAGRPGNLPPAGIAAPPTDLMTGAAGVSVTLIGAGLALLRRRGRGEGTR